MDIRDLSALQLGSAIKKKEIGCREAAEAYLTAIAEKDGKIKSYITVLDEEGAAREVSCAADGENTEKVLRSALSQADGVQARIDAGELDHPLAGVPAAVKDNMCIRGIRTTAASAILEDFRPPYDAGVIENLKAAGGVVLGKVNMDEFAMGGSTETSHYGNIKGMKIGIPSNYYGEGLDPEIREAIFSAAKQLEAQGAVTEEFDMPIVDYAVPAYYIIACAEASSNLSRYDGIKYGHRTKNAQNLTETYYKSRSEGFGTEVKRRIMLGSFVLSSGYFDAYYKKALKVRGLIKKAFDEAFEKYDMILSPVSPTAAYKIGGQIADPIAMYMADIYTVSVNLAGLPAISVPCGFTKEGLPVGMQFIGNSFEEKKLIRMADAYQQMTDYHIRRPEIFGKGGAE